MECRGLALNPVRTSNHPGPRIPHACRSRIPSCPSRLAAYRHPEWV